MELANQFELQDMKRQVEDQAMKHLNNENTVELYFLAEKYEAERLKVEARKGIKKHRKQIKENMSNSKLKKLQLSQLVDILTE